MLKRLYLLMVISYLVLTTGCIAIVVGAGAGAGAFAYFDGQLSRTYEAKYGTTYQVCKSILKDLKQPILEEKKRGYGRDDHLGGHHSHHSRHSGRFAGGYQIPRPFIPHRAGAGEL